MMSDLTAPPTGPNSRTTDEAATGPLRRSGPRALDRENDRDEAIDAAMEAAANKPVARLAVPDVPLRKQWDDET